MEHTCLGGKEGTCEPTRGTLEKPGQSLGEPQGSGDLTQAWRSPGQSLRHAWLRGVWVNVLCESRWLKSTYVDAMALAVFVVGRRFQVKKGRQGLTASLGCEITQELRCNSDLVQCKFQCCKCSAGSAQLRFGAFGRTSVVHRGWAGAWRTLFATRSKKLLGAPGHTTRSSY